MLKCRIQLKNITDVSKFVQKMVKTSNFVISHKEINCIAIDDGNIDLLHVRIDQDQFYDYNADRDMKVGMDFDTLNAVFKEIPDKARNNIIGIEIPLNILKKDIEDYLLYSIIILMIQNYPNEIIRLCIADVLDNYYHSYLPHNYNSSDIKRIIVEKLVQTSSSYKIVILGSYIYKMYYRDRQDLIHNLRYYLMNDKISDFLKEAKNSIESLNQDLQTLVSMIKSTTNDLSKLEKHTYYKRFIEEYPTYAESDSVIGKGIINKLIETNTMNLDMKKFENSYPEFHIITDNSKITLNTKKIEEKKLDVSVLKNIEYLDLAEFSLAEFKKNIYYADLFSEEITFILENNKITFTAESLWGGFKNSYYVNEGDYDPFLQKIENPNKIKNTYSVQYLKNIVEGFGDSKYITIKLKQDVPLFLSALLGNKIEGTHFLAPRIEEREEDYTDEYSDGISKKNIESYFLPKKGKGGKKHGK